jgi:hypothetical protein
MNQVAAMGVSQSLGRLFDDAGSLVDRQLAFGSNQPDVKSGPLGDPTCTECDPQYRCHVCGDGIVNSTEACDGANLNGATCSSQGFGGGTLACGGSCAYDTSGCTP